MDARNHRTPLAGLLLSLALCCQVLPAWGRTAALDKRIYLTGSDFSHWRADTGQWQIVGQAFMNPDNNRLIATKPGSGVYVNGPTGRTVHLFTKPQFGDLRAHIEFMVPKGSNSGVYFMGRYEIQVFDSWGVEHPKYSDCGGIYQRWDENRTPKGYEGHAPRINASRPPGQWQSFDVIFRAPRFDAQGRKLSNARFEKVVHNGIVVHADVELTGPTRASAYSDEKPLGPLMLQGDHGPVAYRNIWVEPAGPNPLFAMDTGTRDPQHQTAKQQVQMLQELGYAGIGLTYTGPSALAEMLTELDKHALRLFTLYLPLDLASGKHPHNPSLDQALPILQGRNTILWLCVPAPKNQRSDPDQLDARLVELIRDLADKAGKYRLRIALYPHHGFYVQRLEHAIELARRIDRRNVGVTFNLCHWLKTERQSDLQALLAKAMPYLFVVTINGADKDGQSWKQLIQTLDRGSFDLKQFLRIVNRCGYTGPVGLQGYGIGGSAYENLRRSMNAWRKLSQALLPTVRN